MGKRIRLVVGTDWELENEADKILAKDREGVTKVSDMKDVLSPDQLERRRNREVYVRSGCPDQALYRGMFRRAYNPRSANYQSNGKRRVMDKKDGVLDFSYAEPNFRGIQ